MRIIFMGTPDFAVPSLDILVKNGYDVVGVVTVPDKPGGRKGLLVSPIKKYAEENGLFLLQPEKLRDPDFIETLRGLRADLQIVVAFKMLPEIVWNMPPMGTMNLHGSLLPRYRGAAPIHRAVMNGDTETGATTFLLKHQIDTGDLLFQEKMPIGPNETTGEVHDRMMHIGAELVLKSVKALETGQVVPLPQEGEATHAPKIFTEECVLNFAQPARVIHNFVRGLHPVPAAWMDLHGKHVKVYRTTLPDPIEPCIETPGTLLTDGKSYLKVATSEGYIYLTELKPEGKKLMSVRDFLNGNPIF